MSDDEMVLVPERASNRTNGRYHTDEECQYVKESFVEIRRCDLSERFGHCRECAGTSESNVVRDRTPSLRTLIARGDVEAETSEPVSWHTARERGQVSIWPTVLLGGVGLAILATAILVGAI